MEREGLSRRQAAARFGVSYSAGTDWVKRHGQTGSLEPGRIGCHKPEKISGHWREWLLARRREPDFTLRGPVAVGPLQLTGLKGRFGLTLQLGYFGSSLGAVAT